MVVLSITWCGLVGKLLSPTRKTITEVAGQPTKMCTVRDEGKVTPCYKITVLFEYKNTSN